MTAGRIGYRAAAVAARSPCCREDAAAAAASAAAAAAIATVLLLLLMLLPPLLPLPLLVLLLASGCICSYCCCCCWDAGMLGCCQGTAWGRGRGRAGDRVRIRTGPPPPRESGAVPYSRAACPSRRPEKEPVARGSSRWLEKEEKLAQGAPQAGDAPTCVTRRRRMRRAGRAGSRAEPWPLSWTESGRGRRAAPPRRCAAAQPRR
jgi:hypothetical protein